MNELERTAWHEAGHAVAYVVHGQPFLYVTVRPTVDAVGRVVVEPSRVDPGVMATIAYAGPIAQGVAEYRHHGDGEFDIEDVITGAFLAGGGCDLNTARKALSLWGDPAHLAAAFESAARSMIDDRWSHVAAVADALLVRGSLDYSAVCELAGIEVAA